MRHGPLYALAGIFSLGALPLGCAEPPARSANEVAPSASTTSPAPTSMPKAAVPTDAPVQPTPPAPSAAPPVDLPAVAAPPSSPLRLSDGVLDATIRARGSVIIGRLTKVETIAKGTKSEGEQCTFSVVKRIPIASDADKTESTSCGIGFRSKIGKTFVLTLVPGRMPWSGLAENQYIEVPSGKEDEAFRVNAERRGATKP